MTEEQESDGGEAVHGGGVGGVNAEGSVVVLVGYHFGLKTEKESDLRRGERKRKSRVTWLRRRSAPKAKTKAMRCRAMMRTKMVTETAMIS